MPLGQEIVVFDRDGMEVSRVEVKPPEDNPNLVCADSPFKADVPKKLILGPPVFSPDGRRVVAAVFCSATDVNLNPRNQFARLFDVTLATGTIKPLPVFMNLRYAAAPRFSPDGSFIAQPVADQFGLCPPESALTVADVGGASSRDLTLTATDELPQVESPQDVILNFAGYDWSPSSDAIVASFDAILCDPESESPFQSVLAGLYVLKLAGFGEEKLVDGPTLSPAWSPSGRFIAYVAGTYFGGGSTEAPTIRLLALTTRQAIDLTQGDAPAWQPHP
jgi:Tol biopolymer transport system component